MRRQNRRRRRRHRRRRRIIIGGVVLLAGGAAIHHRKVKKRDAERIEQHTGQSIEDLSEEELTEAINVLNIEEQLTAEDEATIAKSASEDE